MNRKREPNWGFARAVVIFLLVVLLLLLGTLAVLELSRVVH